MDIPLTSGRIANLPQTTSTQTVNLRQPSAPFTPGQLLQAVVSGKISDANYLLNIGGREVHAQSTATLTIGQRLDLQVASLTPQVELKVIHDPITRQIGTALHLLEGKQSLAPLLSQLLQTSLPQSLSDNSLAILETVLTSLVPGDSGTHPDGRDLKNLVDRLGMNMEQLFAANNRQEALQSLKFALLELGQQPGLGKQQTEQVGQLLQNLELFQMLQVRMQTDSILFIPLPFNFLEQGYLLVDNNKKKNGSGEDSQQETSTFSLHLRLEGLGNLRVEMRQTEGNLDLRFFTESNEKTEFLREHSSELEDWLTAATLRSVQFLKGSDEPGSSLLKRMIGDTTGVINTQA